MEKKHNLTFCPECGAKLDGDEMICSNCGYKLAAIPPTEALKPPVTPPPVQETQHIPPPSPPPISTPPPTYQNTNQKCPNCGSNNGNNELFCNGCGFRLTTTTPPPQSSVPPPIIPPTPPTPEVPKMAPPPINYPPVNEQAFYQPQAAYGQMPPRKKGSGMLIVIIALIVIIVGSGIVSFLQYNGNVRISFLDNIIPSKGNNKTEVTAKDHTRYYVIHSFAVVGKKWNAVVSDVIVSRQPYNNIEGAKNQFTKAIMHQIPKNYTLFTKNIIVNQYKTYVDAQAAHSSIIKQYGSDPKQYIIKTINFNY